MKKSIKALVVIAALAASTFTVSAIKPSYRGFAEGGLAFGSFPSDYVEVLNTQYAYSDIDGSGCLAVNFATSHGVQLTRMFFVGAGIGVNNIIRHDGNDDGYSVPDYFAQLAIFLDGRWDMNLAKKVSPFVDLRLGIATNFDTNDFHIFRSNPYKVGDVFSHWYNEQQPCTQFYIQPTIGVRFRLHHHLGLNVGFTYFTRKRVDIIIPRDSYDHTITEIKSMYKNQFGFVLGLDF